MTAPSMNDLQANKGRGTFRNGSASHPCRHCTPFRRRMYDVLWILLLVNVAAYLILDAATLLEPEGDAAQHGAGACQNVKGQAVPGALKIGDKDSGKGSKQAPHRGGEISVFPPSHADILTPRTRESIA